MANIIKTPAEIRREQDKVVEAAEPKPASAHMNSAERDALHKMHRFDVNVFKMHVEVPAIRKLFRKLDQLITHYLEYKGKAARDMEFDMPELHRNGMVRFKLSFGESVILTPRAKLHGEICFVLMGICNQIALDYADRRLDPKLLAFRDIRISEDGEVCFFIVHDNKPIKQRPVNIV